MTAAIESLAGDRPLEGILARPAALGQLGVQVGEVAHAELERADGHRNRIGELQPVADGRTQAAAAAAEGAVETLEAAHRSLAHDHEVADAAVELAATQLAEQMQPWWPPDPLPSSATCSGWPEVGSWRCSKRPLRPGPSCGAPNGPT